LSTDLEMERKNYYEAMNMLKQKLSNVEDMNSKIQK